ncbi:MAG: hypothetical protein AAF355_03810 [Myxococcota bacterium]
MPTSALFPAYSQLPLFSKISDVPDSPLSAEVSGSQRGSRLRIHPLYARDSSDAPFSEDHLKEGIEDLVVDDFGVLYDFATRAIQSTRYVLHHGPANQVGSCISQSKGLDARRTGSYRVTFARELASAMRKGLGERPESLYYAEKRLNWVLTELIDWEAARYAKSGNCSEHAGGVLTWALRYASNIRVVLAVHENHTYCLFASRARKNRGKCYCIAVDSWVHSHPVVCLPDEHLWPMDGVLAYCMVDLFGAPNLFYSKEVLEDVHTDILAWKSAFKKEQKGLIVSHPASLSPFDRGTNWKGESFLGYRRHIHGKPFCSEDIAVPLPGRPPPGAGIRDHVEYVPGLPRGPLGTFPSIAWGPLDARRL